MNPDEIILFIGGPFDGQRKRWGTTQPVQKVLTLTLGEPFESFYRIEAYRTEQDRKHLAVHDGVGDVMDLLIKGYNPTK